MSDVKTAEELWARAHEHVKRGDFANAVRHLAQCFQILQAANDPRVYEVHRRWTEVHRMYVEDGQRQQPPAEQKAPSVEAEAEAAANAGDLDRAIALYRQAVQQNPDNELITERLLELTQAKARATELTSGTAPPRAATPIAARPATPIVAATAPSTPAVRPSTPAATASTAAVASSTPAARPATAVAPSIAAAVGPSTPVAAARPVAPSTPAARDEDDWSDVSVDEPTTTPASAAPTMAVEDAPVGMQSLDVPFSVGEAIDSFQADELPVEGKGSTPPQLDDVAFLESLLERVHANRRAL